MLTDSIRWRMQLWLGILLLGVLTAFGVASWQLEKTQRIRRLDDALAQRAAMLGEGVRGGGAGGPPQGGMGPPPGRGGPDFGRSRGRPDLGPGRGGPPDLTRDDKGRGGPPRRPPDEFEDEFSEDWDEPPMDIPPDMPEDRVPQKVKDLFPASGPEGFYYAVWVGRSAKLQKSANAPEVPMPSPEGRSTRTQFRDRDGMREAYHFTERGECVLAGRPVGSDLAGMKPFAVRLSLTGLSVLAVGLGGGWLLTSRSIRPIEQIASSARRISEGDLSERIPVGKPGNELGQLATVLNSTFAKLEESFAQQKRFTSDASHELRTPLTVLITETQSALSRERSPEEYREALAGNLDTARQMKRLAESLLELARLDSGDSAGAGEPMDLADPARETLARLKPLAASRSTTLVGELLPASCIGSGDRIVLVISNLVENAIHYGREGGTITVRTWQEGERSFIRVADDGPGIPAGDLPHIFDRFYRADKSRTASGGRYGLGLAICRGLVEAGGGSISVESCTRRGTIFTVAFPAVSGPEEIPPQ